MRHWTPSEKVIHESNLHGYMHWLKEHKAIVFDDYHTLWEWSVENIDEFWESIWQFFNIKHDGQYTAVKSADAMPKTHWFEGVRLNYAEHIFSQKTAKHPAIIFRSESDILREISWQELETSVAALQLLLKQNGIVAGDRVVAYLPCIPEATMAFLAANSLGAVWSSCSPDFGTAAVIDRFAQTEPSVLIAVDDYRYGGKSFDKRETVRDLVRSIPTLKFIVLLTERDQTPEEITKPVFIWKDVMRASDHVLEFIRVPFNDPIWVLYSSGTTGLPKAIVHSQGGILLEQFKYCTFHNDFKPGERCFWYTTTGWMMWNYIHGSLLCGATMVLYDGNPAYPDLNALWKFTEDTAIHHFGTSAGFILANIKEGTKPGSFNLSSLRSLSSTGSTLTLDGFEWVYREVKAEVWLISMSGGTDVCSAFVGGNPLWPVNPGEIQCRALGCKLEAFNEAGQSVLDEMGEMVITEPMPSMPIRFWNDPQFARYEESYFEMFPGLWRHGDWIRITGHHGVIIYGRSDATLNRGGVRIGTSEIYRAVDQIKAVKDSLIVCIEKENGDFWMPLFVVMHAGLTLTPDIKQDINKTIRSAYSPRHVPDEIIAVPDIPYTISGKKTETPVKKVLMGKDPEKVVNSGALKNPESLDFFVSLGQGE